MFKWHFCIALDSNEFQFLGIPLIELGYHVLIIGCVFYTLCPICASQCHAMHHLGTHHAHKCTLDAQVLISCMLVILYGSTLIAWCFNTVYVLFWVFLLLFWTNMKLIVFLLYFCVCAPVSFLYSLCTCADVFHQAFNVQEILQACSHGFWQLQVCWSRHGL